jgi:hypothetical protein
MFRVSHNRIVHIDPLPGIFHYTAPVVRQADDGEREMVLISWGFPLLQAGTAPRRVTKRDDKIDPDQLILAILLGATPPATTFCEPHISASAPVPASSGKRYVRRPSRPPIMLPLRSTWSGRDLR